MKNENLTCGFIGLGLIGGSIAKALRQTYPDAALIPIPSPFSLRSGRAC